MWTIYLKAFSSFILALSGLLCLAAIMDVWLYRFGRTDFRLVFETATAIIVIAGLWGSSIGVWWWIK